MKRTKEYTELLNVLSNLNQKFPASLLRKMKEHIYELVSTNDPTEKIAVVDFDTDTDLDKVDVVIGVGVSGKSEKSYETFSRFDIAEDILYNNKDFDLNELMSKTLPKLVKATSWTPVCKYYKQLAEHQDVDTKVKSAFNRPIEEWQNANPYSYKANSIRETYSSIKEVIDANPPEKAVKMILLLEIEKIDLKVLLEFLKANFNLTQDPQHSSYFMKLVCLYDKLTSEN